MTILRYVAATLGVLLPIGVVLVAFLVGGGTRGLAVSPAMLAVAFVVGLLLGAGFLAFAFVPDRVFAASLLLRILCRASLVAPCLVAIFMASETILPISVLWLAVAVLAVVCMFRIPTAGVGNV